MRVGHEIDMSQRGICERRRHLRARWSSDQRHCELRITLAMTARINTTVQNVAITFDGVDGTAGRAEIIETSPPQSQVRTVEVLLSGLSHPIASMASTASNSGQAVDVRVLGVYGSWTVSEVRSEQEPDVPSFHLRSAGPIMAAIPPV
jgi:hypothetical protein